MARFFSLNIGHRGSGLVISTSHRFIYLHVPKTGGNSIQTALLPISEDAQSVTGHQDGHNRFGVTGPRTRRKHAGLSDYKHSLGEPLENYSVVVSVRHPFPRALSMYFSPGRWLKKTSLGSWESQTPVWSEESFLSLITDGQKLRPIVDFLKLDGVPYAPAIVLRHERLRSDYRNLCIQLQLPSQVACLPIVNRSAASSETLSRLLASQSLRDATEMVFKDDMSYFGYDIFAV
ncbi:sulfotransferase family 2 domain-containing protein [Shimia sagamensis]|uniref:Sulfotransferase family protein n=1 Tax=Shimia sagamensis TaxID=1566352 RepID=A0ABY1NBL1_9RHOB|nr:sulfotransferase family 2 domain-containing protein [Shimia sagamensis]SMP05608.1 Sulfotransferase family protein [Shimia sagamensis]